MPPHVPTLIVGGDSLIGGALAHVQRARGFSVMATTRRREPVAPDRLYLDLAAPPDQWPLPDEVSVAYLCAAISRTIPCRRDPAGTSLVNVERTAQLARFIIERGGRVVFLSTNQVFSGAIPYARADQPVCPVSEYGRQKARAEQRLLAMGDAVTVLRLSKVFSPGDELLSAWADKLRAGEVIRPLGDYYVAPLRLDFVVDALTCLAEAPGLWQASGPRDVSYGEVGMKLAELVGADASLVQPRTTAESGLELEPFGPHTTLDSTKLLEYTGFSLVDPLDAVAYALENARMTNDECTNA